jgi:hypothetical protein
MSLRHLLRMTYYPAMAFQRRADWVAPKTASDSPFRGFVVHCLKCGSFKLRVIGEHDGDSGEVKVYLFCNCCRVRETIPVR